MNFITSEVERLTSPVLDTVINQEMVPIMIHTAPDQSLCTVSFGVWETSAMPSPGMSD